MLLLRTECSLLLRTPQQRLPMLCSGPDKPQICSFPWGSNTRFLRYTRVSPERHLDRFSRFCRAHPRAQQTNRQTSVATGRVYANVPFQSHLQQLGTHYPLTFALAVRRILYRHSNDTSKRTCSDILTWGYQRLCSLHPRTLRRYTNVLLLLLLLLL